MYRRRSRMPARVALAAAAGLLLAGLTHVHAARASYRTSGHVSHAAREAIAYARAHLGDPYVWGATGPDSFDCSGLTMSAYAAAGVSIPRTSQEQWAGLHHVAHPRAGDLVFFDDGAAVEPGHVAIVISARKHLMIQAPQPGESVEIASYAGGGIVGYARPAAGGSR